VKSPLTRRSPGPRDAITVFSGTPSPSPRDHHLQQQRRDRHVHQGGAIARRASRGPARRPGGAYDPSRGNGSCTAWMSSLAFAERAQLRRALPPVRPELAHHPAELAFLLPQGTSTATFTDLAFPSSALNRSLADPTRRGRRKRTARPKALPTLICSRTVVYDIGLTVDATSALVGPSRVQAATEANSHRLPQQQRHSPPSSSVPRTTTHTTQATTPTTGAHSSGAAAPRWRGSAPSVAPAVAVDASGTAYVVWEQSSTN